MKQIEDLVKEQMAEMTKNGAIEALIKEQLQTAVSKAITDAFRSYSSVSKALEELVEEQFTKDVGNIEIPSYTEHLSISLNEVISKHLKSNQVEALMKQIDERLSPAPREMTVQGIIDGIKKYISENEEFDHHNGFELEVDIVQRTNEYPLSDMTQIKFTNLEEVDQWWSSNLVIDIRGGVISNINDMNRGRRSILDTGYGAVEKITHMMIAKTKITDAATVDEDDLDLLIEGIY